MASDEPAVYRIRVLGRLGDAWRDRFGGFELRVINESPPTSALTGLLADQAALMGVLAHLYASGVTLLGVERVDRPCGLAADTVGEDQS